MDGKSRFEIDKKQTSKRLEGERNYSQPTKKPVISLEIDVLKAPNMDRQSTVLMDL